MFTAAHLLTYAYTRTPETRDPEIWRQACYLGNGRAFVSLSLGRLELRLELVTRLPKSRHLLAVTILRFLRNGDGSQEKMSSLRVRCLRGQAADLICTMHASHDLEERALHPSLFWRHSYFITNEITACCCSPLPGLRGHASSSYHRITPCSPRALVIERAFHHSSFIIHHPSLITVRHSIIDNLANGRAEGFFNTSVHLWRQLRCPELCVNFCDDKPQEPWSMEGRRGTGLTSLQLSVYTFRENHGIL